MASYSVEPTGADFKETGYPRFCHHCGTDMPDGGPDACLGLIPGVSHACCGHGHTPGAYVVLGGRPNEWANTIDRITIRGEPAVRFFELVKEGLFTPSDSQPESG